MCMIFILLPMNALAVGYMYNGEYFEFDDTNFWADGWCYRPINESGKTAILVAYNKEVVASDAVVVPGKINGYKIIAFAEGLLRDTDIKVCDLSKTEASLLPEEMFHLSTVEKVILPSTVKEIGGICFYSSNLSEINLLEGLESIGDRAFGYSKIKNITIPFTVKEIKENAFMFCDFLEEIHFKSMHINSIGSEEPYISGNNYNDVIFMTKSLKKLILSENVNKIHSEEFKEFFNSRGYYYSKNYPENLTIYGKKGSYAEIYAAENGFDFVALGSEALSDWAKDDVAHGITLGYVPHELRGNWQDNITRGEYAKLALCFLAVQYGYAPVNNIQTNFTFTGRAMTDHETTIKHFEWKAIEKFVADYCETQLDRDGSPFLFNELNSNYTEDRPLYFSWWWDAISHYFKPFADVFYTDNSSYINAAYLFGLVNGVGEELYNPDAPITRQEAAVMLMRVYANYGGVVSDKGVENFSDSGLIADWAAHAVSDVTAIGVMQGVGSETFDPLGYYTREQAIVTFMRLYENAPISRGRANIQPLVGYETQIKKYIDITILEQYETPSCTILYCNNATNTTSSDYALYIFYRNGGFRNVTYFLQQNNAFSNIEPIFDIQISEDKSQLSYKVYVTKDYNYFCHLDDLYNPNFKYETGGYQFIMDIETGAYVSIEKL